MAFSLNFIAPSFDLVSFLNFAVSFGLLADARIVAVFGSLLDCLTELLGDYMFVKSCSSLPSPLAGLLTVMSVVLSVVDVVESNLSGYLDLSVGSTLFFP